MRLSAALAALTLLTGVAAPAVVAGQTIAASEVPDLAGTRWTGSMVWDDGARYETTMEFRPDGVLVYAYDGRTFDNGRWIQNERLVTFHTNAYYAIYSGLSDGQRLEGTSYNQTGASGRFSFTRSPR